MARSRSIASPIAGSTSPKLLRGKQIIRGRYDLVDPATRSERSKLRSVAASTSRLQFRTGASLSIARVILLAWTI